MNALNQTPDVILHNACLYTVDPRQPWAQAVAITGQTIVAVGTDAEILPLAAQNTQCIDLGGRLVLPGLCDAHIHLYDWCIARREVPLADCTSKAEMVQRIAARAAQTPGAGWITGRGWNESRWNETAFPTAHDLDRVTGADQPAIFWRSDMHAAIVNSAALRHAGIDAHTPQPEGGVIDRDAQGRPTGILRELAIGLVAQHLPRPDGATLDAMLLEGQAALHRLGITAIHDQRMKDHDDGPRMMASYGRLRRRDDLKLRVNCNIAAHDLSHLHALGLHAGFGDEYVRLGHVKIFSDGSLGSRTAWMLEPFAKLDPHEKDNYGVSLTPPQQMATEFRRATELGFPISVHAIGDRANRVCLDIFAELASAGLQPPTPHRIEHVQMIHPDDVPRLAQLGITASVQPTHLIDDMDTADLLLGARGQHTYPFRTLLESGALLALGSDAPVADPNPFLGIHAARYRQRPTRMTDGAWYPHQCLTLEQAIYGYTLGAARAAGWQTIIGSITPGKCADLIVLDRNLFTLAEHGVRGAKMRGAKMRGAEMADTQVEMTLFNGAMVFATDIFQSFGLPCD